LVNMVKIGIIGAGIIGLFTAYYLLKKGYRVEIYERCDRLGCGASGHNAGVLHLVQPPFNSLKSYLARLGSWEYRRLRDILNLDILETELIITSFNKLDGMYLRLVKYVLEWSGYRVEKLSRKDLYVYRGLSREAIGGLRIRGYGVVEPQNVLERLAEYLSNNGVEIIYRHGDLEDIEGDYIIVAAGDGSYKIGEALGDSPPRHRFSLGVMVGIDYEVDAIYAFPPNPLRRHTKGGAVIPKKDYTLIGPGFRWVEKSDIVPDDKDYIEIYNRFRRILREDSDIVMRDHGIRPINIPKDDFIIRRRDKYIFTYGIDSPGFTAAPIIGEIITNLLSLDEKYLEVDRSTVDRYIKH